MSWFDWTLVDKHADIHRFVKQLIAERLDFGQGRTETIRWTNCCRGRRSNSTG